MEQKELEAEELEEQDPVLNRREKRRQFLLDNYKDIFKIVLIVALVVFVIADYNNLSNLNIRDLLASRHSLAGSSFMVLFIYFIKGIVMVIPAAVVYISVGMAFPAWTAVILNTAGMIVELMASYFLGKFLSIDMIDRAISEQRGGNRIIARLQKNSRATMFILRFVPIFPVDIISLFYGSTKYPFWKYMGWSMLGIMPRVILFTLLGKKIYDWFPEITAMFILYLILFILFCSLIGGMVVHFRKKHKKKARIKELARDEEFMVSDEDQGFRIVKTAMAATSDKKEEK